MDKVICPECKKEIPDYRQESPYCDCGWGVDSVSEDYDRIGWLSIIGITLGIIVAQIFILFVIHHMTTFFMSIMENYLIQEVGTKPVILLHFLTTITIDTIALGILYFTGIYYLARNHSSPILISMTTGIFILASKIIIIDPISMTSLAILGWISNVFLLLIIIGTGILARSQKS